MNVMSVHNVGEKDIFNNLLRRRKQTYHGSFITFHYLECYILYILSKSKLDDACICTFSNMGFHGRLFVVFFQDGASTLSVLKFIQLFSLGERLFHRKA